GAEDGEAAAQDRAGARVGDGRVRIATVEGSVVAGRDGAGFVCRGRLRTEVDAGRRVQDQPGCDVGAVLNAVGLGQLVDADAPAPRQREQRIAALDDVLLPAGRHDA